MTGTKLKAPFPAFGGKSRVAELVWSRLGPVRNYVEPFCFSAAMLLLRPHEPQIETVNDLNAYVANFWRAIQGDPEAVAHYADWPVNETDLHARHSWLVRSTEAAERLQEVRDNPEAYNAKIAGWWCWGACMWIGSGWCDSTHRSHDSEVRPSTGPDGYGNGITRWSDLSQQIPLLRGGCGQGVTADGDTGKRLQLSCGNTTHGNGVHGKATVPEKKPILTSDGGTGDKGVNSVANLREQSELAGQRGVLSQQVPELAGQRGVLSQQVPELAGQRGVLSQQVPELAETAGRPQLADAYSRGRGIHGNDEITNCEKRRLWLTDWFTRLSDRLRPVRVCCGHWDRVCDSDSTLTRLGLTGVFLDPPYRKRLACGKENRAAHIYANDKSQDVDGLCDEVQAWCLKWGGSKDIRIAVCGLEGEYPELDAAGWDKVAWKSQGGYGNRNKNNDNAARERIWFNRSCLTGTEHKQAELFQ